MQLSIISGSQRQDSNSFKVAQIIAAMALQHQRFSRTNLVNLATQPLPLFDPSLSSAGSWPSLSLDLQESQAFVIISPEWHGMVPSALKNFFLYAGQKELGHKPALIVTVSSGVGGSYPVDELRVSSYKNSRLLYIPDQVILRHVATFIQHYPDSQDEIQKNLQGRLAYGLSLLREYALALKQVRESEIFNPALFSNGM